MIYKYASVLAIYERRSTKNASRMTGYIHCVVHNLAYYIYIDDCKCIHVQYVYTYMHTYVYGDT